jgi:hypothetical protein
MRWPFLRSDYEIAGVSEAVAEPIQNLSLQGRLKIGERNIAAENEIEQTFWRF